jgi:hypothetical protein
MAPSAQPLSGNMYVAVTWIKFIAAISVATAVTILLIYGSGYRWFDYAFVVGILFAGFFSRGILVLAFWTITIIVCAQMMFKSSFVVGFAALVACVLCYWGAAAFMGSLLERCERRYRPVDLARIGALASLLIVAGSALMWWSGFSLHLFDVPIGGVTWALFGAASAVVVVRIEDALEGNYPSALK